MLCLPCALPGSDSAAPPPPGCARRRRACCACRRRRWRTCCKSTAAWWRTSATSWPTGGCARWRQSCCTTPGEQRAWLVAVAAPRSGRSVLRPLAPELVLRSVLLVSYLLHLSLPSRSWRGGRQSRAVARWRLTLHLLCALAPALIGGQDEIANAAVAAHSTLVARVPAHCPLRRRRSDTHYLLYIHDRLKQQLAEMGEVRQDGRGEAGAAAAGNRPHPPSPPAPPPFSHLLLLPHSFLNGTTPMPPSRRRCRPGCRCRSRRACRAAPARGWRRRWSARAGCA